MKIFKKPGRMLASYVKGNSGEYFLLSALRKGIKCKFNGFGLTQDFDENLSKVESEDPRIQALIELARMDLPEDFPIEYIAQELDPSFEPPQDLVDPARKLLLQAITVPTDLKKTGDGYTYKGEPIESFEYQYLVDKNLLGIDDVIKMFERIKTWKSTK